MRNFKLLLGLMGFVTFVTPMIVSASTDIEANKKVVRDFYETAFNQHKPVEAMDRYVGGNYIQHNPFVANGKKPFIDFFVGFYKKHPKAKTDIKRILGDGDLVVVHTHSMVDDNDKGRAVMDIFRIENGKL